MKIMKTCVAILLGGMWLVSALHAQTTNAPRTEIELLEGQTNVVVVKCFGPAGSVNLGQGILSVRLKESFNADTGRKLHGLTLTYVEGGQHERAVLDYDEIEPLIKGMDYIRAASYDVTSLSGFEAVFLTKNGFRVIGLGSPRQNSVQTFLQFDDGPRVLLNSDQIAQLRNVIAQSRNALDDLRVAK
jgi:hypothetical protein